MRDLRTGNVGPMRNLKPLNVYHWPGRGYYMLLQGVLNTNGSGFFRCGRGGGKSISICRAPIPDLQTQTSNCI